MGEKANLILLALGGALVLGILYFLTKPPPAQTDISADELGGLVVTVAKYYYGGA